MARRHRKGRKHGKGAIPLAQAAIVAYPLLNAYKMVGMSAQLPAVAVFQLTGFNPTTKRLESPGTALAMGGSLLALQLIGSKIANRTGANRIMKKLSGGYLKIA